MNDESFLRDHRILTGRYRVDHRVASGGFGVVYAAHHLVLDVPVAIKVLHDRFADSPDPSDAVAAFLHEARTLARLRHPNIVGVIDAGVVPGASVPWIALEWCDGKTLEALMADGDVALPMTPSSAWKLLRPAAEAIAYAHGQRVVHRDLKPSNIMVVRVGAELVPRVVDFGLAKAIEAAESNATTTRRAFTPAYAAPEQITAKGTGPWTDVHALALVFTQLVTGQRPYARTDELMAALASERPTPRRLGVTVAPMIEDVIERALSVDRSARPPDGAAFVREMDAAIAGARGAETIASFAAQRTTGNVPSADPSLSVGGVDAPRVASLAPGSRRGVVVAGAAFAAVMLTAVVSWRLAVRPVVTSAPAASASSQAADIPAVGIVTTRQIPAYTRDSFEAAMRAAGYQIDMTQENVSTGFRQLMITARRPPCSGVVHFYEAEAAKTISTAIRMGIPPPGIVARDGTRILSVAQTDVGNGPSARCASDLLIHLTSPKIGTDDDDTVASSTPPPPAPPKSTTKLAADALIVKRLRAAGFEILRDERKIIAPQVAERWLSIRKGAVEGPVRIIRGFDRAPESYAATMRAQAGDALSAVGADWLVIIHFNDMETGQEILQAVQIEPDAGAH